MLAVPRIYRGVRGVGNVLLAIAAFCLALALLGLVGIATSDDKWHTFLIGDFPALVAATVVGVPGLLLRSAVAAARRTALRERDRVERLRREGVRAPGTVISSGPAPRWFAPTLLMIRPVRLQTVVVRAELQNGASFVATLTALRTNSLVPGYPVTICYDPAHDEHGVPLEDLDEIPRV